MVFVLRILFLPTLERSLNSRVTHCFHYFEFTNISMNRLAFSNALSDVLEKFHNKKAQEWIPFVITWQMYSEDSEIVTLLSFVRGKEEDSAEV